MYGVTCLLLCKSLTSFFLWPVLVLSWGIPWCLGIIIGVRFQKPTDYEHDKAGLSGITFSPLVHRVS